MKYSSPNSQIRTSQYQSNQQQYQQQFWKLKAQRLQVKNEQINKENQSLLKKIMETQHSADKFAFQSIDVARSRRKDQKPPKGKSSQAAAQQEIERLGKQILVIKNAHSLQITKITEESKRFKKKIADLQNKLATWISSEDHANRVRTISQQNNALVRKQGLIEQQLDRLKEQKKKLLQDNDNLRKQLQQMHAKSKAAEKQQEQNLLDRRKYESFIIQYKAEKNQSPQKSERYHQAAEPQKINQQEIDNLKRSITNLQRERQNNQRLLLQLSSWQHEKARAQIKIKQVQAQLTETKSELKNVLTKLSPLLSQRSDYKGKQNVQAKASLTLLQVFLQKYKIQAF